LTVGVDPNVPDGVGVLDEVSEAGYEGVDLGPVGYFGLVPAAHGRGRRDRVRACTLCDMGFDPNHHARAVRSRRNSGIWGLVFGGG